MGEPLLHTAVTVALMIIFWKLDDLGVERLGFTASAAMGWMMILIGLSTVWMIVEWAYFLRVVR